ncbi:MAG: hypothetical protein QW818_00410 [Candidatus Aenigmatarchaeota archaeon]|nr:hypothetical protein [Candidatus Aenigmarchaeota archaeon]
MTIDNTFLRNLRNKLNDYSTLYGTPFPPLSPFADYRTYVRRVRDANERFNRMTRRALSTLEFPHMALIITGSNGRLEGYPSSPVEYVIVGDLPNVESLPDLEVKDFGSCMSFYMNDPNRVFPSRVLDGFVVGGDEEYLQQAKKKVIEEMRDTRIMRKIRDKRKESQRIMETGCQKFKGSFITHFDLNRGLALYQTDNGGGEARSFKYGPLRYVQLKILEELYNLIEKGYGHAILEMPTNTAERLIWMHDINLLKLTSDEVKRVINSYRYFLWLYHLSQYLHHQKGYNELQFDAEEVKEHLETLRLLDTKA